MRLDKWRSPLRATENKGTDFKSVINGDESLAYFMRAMADFERKFCDEMTSGTDYTLVMEIRGNSGELLHCRVKSDNFRRPNGVEKKIDGKR
jgi:hypothetical protein